MLGGLYLIWSTSEIIYKGIVALCCLWLCWDIYGQVRVIHSPGVALWLIVLLPSQMVYFVCHHRLRGYNQWVERLYNKVQSQQNQQFLGRLVRSRNGLSQWFFSTIYSKLSRAYEHIYSLSTLCFEPSMPLMHLARWLHKQLLEMWHQVT